MYAYKAWKIFYTKKHLKAIYYEKVRKKPSIGLDKISPSKFEKELDNNIDIILRKVNNDTYKFTKYKQLLFLKGEKKYPRSVCVPTLRDKLTITILNELIIEIYGSKCVTKMPQVIINDIVTQTSNYRYFIKIDISTFYSSIDQTILINFLKKKIRKPQVLNLIIKAIRTPAITYPIKIRNDTLNRTSGIPEGLAISNSLANIYLSSLDEKYGFNEEIAYWRYVDDILIFTNDKSFLTVKEQIESDLNKLKLNINDKKDEGRIDIGFSYLGYQISKDLVGVRESSILKIEQSLEDLFRHHKNYNFKLFEWKLNLKITGFITNKHKYGWMFFFSQITDIRLLFHLDDLVRKFCLRYKVKEKLIPKRFVRTYYEIRKSLYKTTYIPNIDRYSLQQKIDILSDIYGFNISKLSNNEIELHFNNVISKEIESIEKDVQPIS